MIYSIIYSIIPLKNHISHCHISHSIPYTIPIVFHERTITIYRNGHNYRTELGVQKYGKIPYFRNPPDPPSARIRILFYKYFFGCFIIYLCSSTSGLCKGILPYIPRRIWPYMVQYIPRSSNSHWNHRQHADCVSLSGYLHVFTSFYVSFWDPGRMYIETRIIERNCCKFNYRTRNYRTELVNVRNMGGKHNYGTHQ